MATYQELFDLRSHDALRMKICVAVAKKAQSLLDGGTPTQGQVAWASAAIADPMSKAAALMNYVLAKNSSATVAQITGATDAAIQANVDSAVNAIIGGA